MSKSKYQATPFSKFFLFMAVFLTISYFGISMFKGQSFDEILQNVKNKVSNVGFSTSKNQVNVDEKTLLIIAEKDAEIQKLREELFICNNKK
jgi:hypothetical protein